MALVIDTGPLLAALDRSDRHHRACRALLEEAEALVLPAPILPEVDYWCARRLGSDAFRDLIDEIRRGVFSVEDLALSDYERVSDLLQQYEDLRVGFVDCAVLAVVERLGESKLATLDRRHFTVMRPRHAGSLSLLPD